MPKVERRGKDTTITLEQGETLERTGPKTVTIKNAQGQKIMELTARRHYREITGLPSNVQKMERRK